MLETENLKGRTKPITTKYLRDMIFGGTRNPEVIINTKRLVSMKVLVRGDLT